MTLYVAFVIPDGDDVRHLEPRLAHIARHELVNVYSEVETLCGQVSCQYVRTDRVPIDTPTCEACTDAL